MNASSPPPPPGPPPAVVERRGEDGHLLETVSLDPAGGLEGPFVAYDGNGRPQMRLSCRAGQPDGPATVYRDGQPEVQLAFAAGHLDGTMRIFDAAGRVAFIVCYVAGQRHGLMECRSPESGQPLLTAEYRNDRLNGAWTEFHPDGSVRRRAQYRNDLLDGETLVFHPDGQPAERTVYAAGQVVAGPQKIVAPAPPKAKAGWRRMLGVKESALMKFPSKRDS
jgi:antitoxin component YwqK of YwqJK toxin-antitoxin module